MVDAFIWLIAIEILGALAFPLAFLLFRRLPDRGYTLTKPLALVLSSYLLWIAGLTHLIPNARITIFGILLLGALIAGWTAYWKRGELRDFLRSEWRTLLVAEAVFLGFFVLWLAIVSEIPAINHTEKPMDFAFLNAIWQSKYFPPEDPWLAGHSISYYYFGHFMMAALIKITGVGGSVGYNLAISLIPALLGIGSFGLLYNLVRLSGGSRAAALGFGLVAPVLVMLIGNLEGALEFVYARGWGSEGFWQWVGIKGLEGGQTAATGLCPDQPWWWWRATRVIDTLADGQSLDYTITEFPFFSFILGDLHAHVTSLPFLLLFLSVGLNLFVSPEKFGLGWIRRHPVESLAVALLLGTLAFVNSWDFPVYAVILCMIIFTKTYRDSWAEQPRSDLAGANDVLGRTVQSTVLMLVPLVAGAVVLFLPFYLDLSTQASGVLPVTDHATRPLLFFLVMGLFLVLAASFVLRQLPSTFRPTQSDAPAVLMVLIFTLFPFLAWGVTMLLLTLLAGGLLAGIGEVIGRFLWIMPGLVIVGLAGISALQRARLGREPLAALPLLLVAAAFYLLVGAELFYLVDGFGNRMNTVFKLYYQSWLLLAIAGAYGLYYWHSHRPARRIIPQLGHYAWVGVVVLLLAVSLYYPVGAVLDRTGIFGPGHRLADNTLDGLAFVKEADPDEYAAIHWLRDQAPPGRIVEAVGNDYSDYGRISASTGLPTVLGWKGHELQWRGTTTIFDGREEDVAEIYQSGDPERILRLLQRYDIRYIYSGRRERASYGSNHLENYDSFLRTVFQQGSVTIYERVDGLEPGELPEANNGPSKG